MFVCATESAEKPIPQFTIGKAKRAVRLEGSSKASCTIGHSALLIAVAEKLTIGVEPAILQHLNATSMAVEPNPSGDITFAGTGKCVEASKANVIE